MINTSFLKYRLAIAVLRERIQRLSTADRMDFDKQWEIILGNVNGEAVHIAMDALAELFAEELD